MFSDKEVARCVIQKFLEATAILDDARSCVGGRVPDDEWRAFNTALGNVLGAMYVGVLDPIVSVHADLLPDAWRSPSDTPREP